MLTNKREGLVIKHCNDFKGFMKYSSDMDGIDENIEEYNLKKVKRNIFSQNIDI